MKCPHVGKLNPSKFYCIDCEDTADKCNCYDCNGAWCDLCNDIIDQNCEDIRSVIKLK